MRRFALTLGLLVAIMSPSATYASHSAAGGAACGVNEWDGVGFMTKGRTDGMVYTVNHTVRGPSGCDQTVKIRNLVGTGTDEAYGYPGQASNCQRYGQQDAARTFEFYFDNKVDPGSIKVTCSAYSGPD